jgi:hypothetical protein
LSDEVSNVWINAAVEVAEVWFGIESRNAAIEETEGGIRQ